MNAEILFIKHSYPTHIFINGQTNLEKRFFFLKQNMQSFSENGLQSQKINIIELN